MSQPSVKKNYIYSLFYQILNIITPFITAPYVSRVIGADGIGIYSYSQSYMTYFSMFATLGTSAYGMREIARCRNDRYECSKKFWEIELLTVFTTLFSMFGWSILIFFFNEYRIYFIALSPFLVAAMFDISWFFTGQERMGYTVFVNTVCKIVGVICIFAFVNDRNDLFLYILLQSLIVMFGNISMWLFLPRFLVKVNPREFTFLYHFRETLIYFIPTISTTIYTVLDKTLIGLFLHDNYQNGYYEQSTKIINMGKVLVFVSVNKVMGARISYLFAEDRIDEIKSRIEKSLNYIMLLGFAVTFGIISIARDFVPLFFGDGYEPVVSMLYWMSPLILIIGISNCLGSQYYTPAGLRAKSSKYIIVGSVTNLVMNLILIPSLGSKGAIVGSVIAELVITILYMKNCNHYLTVKQIILCSYKRLLAGCMMVGVIRIISRCGLTGLLLLLVEVFVGGIVFLAILFILKDAMIIELYLIIERRVRNNG